MNEAGKKNCSVCGVDVSNRRRVKDAAGRYMCEDCFNKARAARGAQTAPAAQAKKAQAAEQGSSDNSFLLDLGSKKSLAERGTQQCPECGRAMTDDTRICVGCGLDVESGKRLRVKVLKKDSGR